MLHRRSVINLFSVRADPLAFLYMLIEFMDLAPEPLCETKWERALPIMVGVDN